METVYWKQNGGCGAGCGCQAVDSAAAPVGAHEQGRRPDISQERAEATERSDPERAQQRLPEDARPGHDSAAVECGRRTEGDVVGGRSRTRTARVSAKLSSAGHRRHCAADVRQTAHLQPAGLPRQRHGRLLRLR